MPIVSQETILEFPDPSLIQQFLVFLDSKDNRKGQFDILQIKTTLEHGMAQWLRKRHGRVFNTETILFIDFALCQTENASDKYFLIVPSNPDNQKSEESERDIRAIYKDVIDKILDKNQGVAKNYKFTSGQEIHAAGYPYFSGIYIWNDSDGDNVPSCLKSYATQLSGKKKLPQTPFSFLASWCAIPVNTLSQTGIYNLAQVFIGFKTEITESDITPDSSSGVGSMIKDLVSFIHYLSHWRSNDVEIIEKLFTIQSNSPKQKSSESKKEQTDREYFQNRLSLFFTQFKNLLLVRTVIMPSTNSASDLTYAYNFVLSRISTATVQKKKNSSLIQDVLTAFKNDREKASVKTGSIAIKQADYPSEPQRKPFSTDLIPIPGTCVSQPSPRGDKKTNAYHSWSERWESWSGLRMRTKGAAPATMVFIPINTEQRDDNETYVYAEFYGAESEIEAQLKVFQQSVLSVINDTINILQLRETSRIRAVSSAIGSIMSRNGSHNIGSHVLSALSHNIGTMPDDRVLYQYLQQRMDYTATVTTDFPNWIAPTRFVANLMKTFFSQRHLLEHISESEGLGAYHFQGRHVAGEQKAKIKLHLRRFDSGIKNIVSKQIWEEAYKTHPGKESKWKEFTDYGENTGKQESLLKDDVTVAIPGGVVGQHAFYTIVENIIRNAAKHEWASNDRDFDIDNLEIYIDFIDLKDSAKVEFTVWNACGGLKVGENEDGSLPAEDVKKWVEKLKVMDPGQAKKDLTDFTRLPLHRQLQVRLAQWLITDDGTLRRENWGLAEMKISAGYLQRRSIGTIGGLVDLKNPDDYIIQPVAVPDPKLQNKYHLGYRFHIPKSKKILIVTDSSSNSTVSSALKEAGIYFKTIDEIEKDPNEKNENGEVELAYEYVVLPSFPEYKDTSGKSINFGKWLLPFRVLIAKQHAEAANKNENVLFKHKPFFGEIDYNNLIGEKLIGENDAVKIQTAVYTAWLEGLKGKCLKSDDDCGKQLYLQVQAEGSSGSGQGLVSDRDLYSVVFCECGHSIMMEATRHQKDKTARRLTTLLALMPMDARDPKYFPNGNGIDSSDYIRDRLRDFCDRFKRELSLNDAFIQMARKLYYDAAAEVVGEKLSQFEQLFLRNVQLDLLNGNAFTKSRVSDLLRHLVETSPRKLSAALDAFCGGETSDFYDSERDPDDIYDSDEEQSQLQKNISRLFGSAELPDEFSELIDKLNSAYLTSDVFLRKYEENISTLPSFYKEQPRAGDTAADGNPSFPIVKPLPLSPVDGTVIRYLRHDNTQKGHYVEALSGSQSYLNALISFDWSKLELITRATENGLLRVLIIDERVYNFLKVRPYELEACRKMNIYAADIENAGRFRIPDHGFVTVVNPQKNQNTKGFGIQAGDFDILIIHQGIIDKWVNAHDRDPVGKLLDEFEQCIPYVVVTTGRGRPDNIPDNARVLPFSTIESTLFRKYPEKLVLVNTVMNILPAKPKKDPKKPNPQPAGA